MVIKRLFDFFIASLMLIVLALPILVLIWLVHYKLGSPVFFRQVRPGLNGKPFEIVKFRTMTGERDSDGKLYSETMRLTTFSRFLRATSLDELPELWNVLKGDMSLVGPRPLLMEYLPLFSPEQARRHEVRPGISGWAQVNGRNAISWEDKFKFDVWYVDNRNMRLDIQILIITIVHVFKRHGITPIDREIMPRFTGSTKK